MVVVEYFYEDIKQRINLPRDKVIDGLSSLGAPSEFNEETGKIMSELTPNRPDWYSLEGLVRALRAYYKNELPEYTAKKSTYEVVVDPSVQKIRPYTVCAVVRGLKFDDRRIADMILLQEKLITTLGRKVKKFGLGLYPLHEIAFPVRYMTMKPNEIRYVPLGYDREMTADEILKVHKKGQQHGHILSGADRYPVFVDAKDRIMCLIPIVNSAETGKVDETTKDLFVEVTGVDFNACAAALNILVCAFIDMGGTAYAVQLKYGKETKVLPDLTPKKMKVDLGQVNKVLGTKLTEKEVAKLLAKMGYRYQKGMAFVPPYRADILGLVDVVEDIAIAYGYNEFEPTIPNFFNPGQAIRKYDGLDAIMRGMGFLETKTFILTNKQKLERVGCREEVVEILNPCTEDYTVIRPNLLSDILDTFVVNKMKGLPQRFYEIGLVQTSEGTKRRLVFGVMNRKVDFSEVRGYLQTLMHETNRGLTLQKSRMEIFDQEISCNILVENKKLGIFGKVDRKILERYGLGFEVYICEIEL